MKCRYKRCDGELHARGLCNRHYKRLRRKENPEILRAQGRRYYRKHRKRLLKKTKQLRLANPEKFRKYSRKHYRKNREKIKERLREKEKFMRDQNRLLPPEKLLRMVKKQIRKKDPTFLR